MRSVSSAVEVVITQDTIALEAIMRGVLNLSAYAEEIQPEIEKITWKEVKKGTIVVALSRFIKEMHNNVVSSSIRPYVYVDDISIRSPLCNISFEKTKKAQEATKKILESTMYLKENSFFTITEGVSEITLIVPQKICNTILNVYLQPMYNLQPKAVYRNLVGISVKFSEKYLSVPNVVYTLLGKLAVDKINVIEVVSTYTELAIIVEEKYTEQAVLALRTCR